MRQRFFDATGKEKAPPDDSGGTINRAITMLKKLVMPEPEKPKPAAKAAPKPVFVKKNYERGIDPDTGEPKKMNYDAVKKPKSKTPPRMPPARSSNTAPTSAPAAPGTPRVPAARMPGPPPFDPSVIPGADGGKPGWGRNRPPRSDPPNAPPDPMPGLPPSVPGIGRNKPPGTPPVAPPPQQPPGTRPPPSPQPPPIMPPVDPGPPLASAPGGTIFDGKACYDGKKKKR